MNYYCIINNIMDYWYFSSYDYLHVFYEHDETLQHGPDIVSGVARVRAGPGAGSRLPATMIFVSTGLLCFVHLKIRAFTGWLLPARLALNDHVHPVCRD